MRRKIESWEFKAEGASTPHGRPCRFPRPTERAFSLVELLIASIILSVIGAAAYTVMNTGLVLYAKNLSLNLTHHDGRTTFEKLADELRESVGSAELLDAQGAPTSGDGPAAGIRFAIPNGGGSYTLDGDVLASDAAIPIVVAAGQVLPLRGDVMIIAEAGFQAEVRSVSGTTGSVSIQLHGNAGNYMQRPMTTGVAIDNPSAPGQYRVRFYNRKAWVATGTDLRYYQRAVSVAVDGETTFNNPSTFRVVSGLLNTATTPLPFSYTDADRRSLNVNLRLHSRTGSGGADYTCATEFRTTVGFRSNGLTQ